MQQHRSTVANHSFHEEHVEKMSALLDEQQALLRVANDHARRGDAELKHAAVDVVENAGVLAVILRHHLARLGATPLAASPTADAHEVAMSRVRSRPSPRRLYLIGALQQRFIDRLWHKLVRHDDETLAATLSMLLSMRQRDRNKTGVRPTP